MALTVAQVQQAYVAFFNRPADLAGLNYWTSSPAASVAHLLDAFSKTPEYSQTYSGKNSTELVNAVYQNLFGRPVESVEALNYWVGLLDKGTVSLGNIAATVSNLAIANKTTDGTLVNNKVAAATSFTDALSGSANAAAASAYASINTTGMTAVKNWLAGVTSDAATLTSATNALPTLMSTVQNNQGASGSTFTLTSGQDSVTGTANNDVIRADHTTLQATDVINGNAGTDTFEYTDAGTTGGAIPAALVSNVEIVNIRNANGSAAVAATKEQVTLTFNDYTHNANSSITVGGTTLNLTATTTGAAIAAAFGAGSLPAGYEFVSLTGNQLVLRATTAGVTADITTSQTLGGTSAMTAPTLSIVQGVAAVASTGVDDTVAASNFSGATEFNSVNSLNKVIFTGLSGTQTLGVIGNGTVLNGNVDYTLAATAAATTINVKDGVKQGTVTNTGATVATATVNSTGAANTLTSIDLGTGNNVTSLTVNAATNLKSAIANDFAATAALTVAGAASSVELTNGANATFKTIDASGLTTGGLTIALSTTATSFKGGQGNDVVTTAAITGQSIDAGAGTADVLVVNAATDTDTSVEAAQYKNFEVLRTADDQDMSLFTASTIGAIQVNAATSKTISKITATQAANITVRDDQTTNLTLTLADATGSADVVNMTLNNPTATAAAPADVDVAGLKVIGVETLNITSSGGGTNLASAATLNSLAFGTGGADKLKTITVAGASSLDLSLANTAVAVTVTSSQTGSAALKLAGDVIKGSSITTTGNADNVTLTGQIAGGSSDFATYSTGAGDDAISATVAALNNTDNTKGNVKLDAGAGTDTLTFSEGGLSAVDANFQFVTGVEKIVVGADGAVSLTTGGFFNTNFKDGGIDLTADVSATDGDTININMATFTGNVKATLKNATDSATTIVTGSGTDTITATNAGTAVADTITVNAGAGNDSITINSSATGAAAVVVVTGGAGADTITLATRGAASNHNQATFNIAAGESTVAAADSITGFRFAMNTGTLKGDILNFDNVQLAGTQTAAAVTGYTGAELTYSISSVGKLTFAGSKAAALTSTEMANLAQTLVAASNGDTVFFVSGNDTYVFNNDTSGDSLVKLVGVSADGMTATAGFTTTDKFIVIG